MKLSGYKNTIGEYDFDVTNQKISIYSKNNHLITFDRKDTEIYDSDFVTRVDDSIEIMYGLSLYNLFMTIIAFEYDAYDNNETI